jgi:hypothetical protein
LGSLVAVDVLDQVFLDEGVFNYFGGFNAAFDSVDVESGFKVPDLFSIDLNIIHSSLNIDPINHLLKLIRGQLLYNAIVNDKVLDDLFPTVYPDRRIYIPSSVPTGDDKTFRFSLTAVDLEKDIGGC